MYNILMWKLKEQITKDTKIGFKLSAVVVPQGVNLIKHVFGDRGEDYEWIGTVVDFEALNESDNILRVDMGCGVLVYVHPGQVRVRSCGG